MNEDRLPALPIIYILGAGAVGLPLATYLAFAGRRVVVVRTREMAATPMRLDVTIHGVSGEVVHTTLESVRLKDITHMDGLVVVTAKAHANRALAQALAAKAVRGPLVILQNGVGVECPFLEAGFQEVYRGVVYVTSETVGEVEVRFRSIASCPIGPVTPDHSSLAAVVAALTTPFFPFHTEAGIGREIWKKAIVNAVFNSICPLLDIDNGVFIRDEEADLIARQIVTECVQLARRLGHDLMEDEVAAQIQRVSRGSQGVLISTLQDLRHGRETEMDSLNLEMARQAEAHGLDLGLTRLLGRLVSIKSRLGIEG